MDSGIFERRSIGAGFDMFANGLFGLFRGSGFQDGHQVDMVRSAFQFLMDPGGIPAVDTDHTQGDQLIVTFREQGGIGGGDQFLVKLEIGDGGLT